MKKLLLIFGIALCISACSGGNTCQTAPTVDSTYVDSIDSVGDSLLIDTISFDGDSI